MTVKKETEVTETTTTKKKCESCGKSFDHKTIRVTRTNEGSSTPMMLRERKEWDHYLEKCERDEKRKLIKLETNYKGDWERDIKTCDGCGYGESGRDGDWEYYCGRVEDVWMSVDRVGVCDKFATYTEIAKKRKEERNTD